MPPESESFQSDGVTPVQRMERRGGRIDTADTEDNEILARAAAERGESQAGRRAAKRAAKSNEANPAFGTEGGTALHVFPVDGETDTFISAEAVELMGREVAGGEIARKEDLERENQAYQFFLQCEFGHQGIYFTGKPVSASRVAPNEWFAAYKRRSDPVPYRVVCQVCQRMHNKITPMACSRLDDEGYLQVDTERVFRVPKDARRARLEGISRGLDSRWDSNNTWKEEHAKKVERILAQLASEAVTQ